MRLSFFWVGAFAVIAGAVSPALAASIVPGELFLRGCRGATYAPLNENGGAVPSVTRGQPLGIACADVNQADADVRVVMQVSNSAGDSPTGYAAVLATDQTVERGMVHIRVPDVPGLAQHTVSIKVFVVDRRGTHSCNAGRVRIV